MNLDRKKIAVLQNIIKLLKNKKPQLTNQLNLLQLAIKQWSQQIQHLMIQKNKQIVQFQKYKAIMQKLKPNIQQYQQLLRKQMNNKDPIFYYHYTSYMQIVRPFLSMYNQQTPPKKSTYRNKDHLQYSTNQNNDTMLLTTTNFDKQTQHKQPFSQNEQLFNLSHNQHPSTQQSFLNDYQSTLKKLKVQLIQLHNIIEGAKDKNRCLQIELKEQKEKFKEKSFYTNQIQEKLYQQQNQKIRIIQELHNLKTSRIKPSYNSLQKISHQASSQQLKIQSMNSIEQKQQQQSKEQLYRALFAQALSIQSLVKQQDNNLLSF